MPLSPSERRLRASAAGLTGWANTAERSKRAAHAGRGLYEKFYRETDTQPARGSAGTGWPILPDRAHLKRMAFRSAQGRRQRKEAAAREAEGRRQARQAESLAAGGGS